MFVVVPRRDRLRPIVEDSIRRLYRKRYDALLTSFAPTIAAELSAAGTLECGAGIRFADEALFLERYLDLPVEQTLGGLLGGAVKRAEIVEVCHLAGAGAGRSLPFVYKLIELLREMGAAWAVFTATRPLRDLLLRNGLAMLELAHADGGRMPDPSDWGHYFKHDPRVMAVNNQATFAAKLCAAPSAATRFSADARIL